MKNIFYVLFLLISGSLLSADRDITSFEEISEKKYIEHIDFSGEYPNLERVSIDGTKKFRAEFLMNGIYPKLGSIKYVGSFGDLKADLSGSFTELKKVEFTSGSVALTLDLTGSYENSLDIAILNKTGSVTLLVPKDVGISLQTKTGVRGRVSVPETLVKQGRGWLKKNFETAHAEKKFNIYFEGDKSTLTILEKDRSS